MLRSETINVAEVTPKQRERMLALMHEYYENVDALQFNSDLNKKDRIILLKNDETICGFSTQLLSSSNIEGHLVKFLFSGDTIIERPYRNSLALPLAWSKIMLDEINTSPEVPLYWLLTTKGYKTYRYLSVFFNDFFPRPNRELSAFEQQALESFTAQICIEGLDHERWIIRAQPSSQRLRKGVADITDNRLKKPEIAFFEEVNPGHASGDELICLARFCKENLTPFIWRKFKSL